ncbi:bleomycin hydrolase [Rhizoctonia solani AG-1 IB]|nr:bleomycin hydrolase [Rhizoctonia solani AG-1 IB]
MVISGVHLDKQGNPVRYRIENSWGDVNGDKGYYVMTDRWFDEYVFQVVVPRQLASRDLVKVLDGGNPVVLPAWDPMGALA